jgi:hypothetical protein
MTPVSSHFLQTSDRTLLRYGQRLVPEHCREEWLRYWYAELCHLRSRNPTWGRHSLALGLLLDAAWLRQESWRRNLSGTATLCLVLLIFLLPLAALPLFVLAGNLKAFGITLVVSVPSLISGALPILIVGHFTSGRSVEVCTLPLHSRLKGRSFYAAKIALLLPITFLLSADLTAPLHPLNSFPGFLLQSFIFALLALSCFRWATFDCNLRCKHCLRSLAVPVRVGRPSHNFLEWNGIELPCTEGHGVLSIPEIETSSYSSSRWSPGSHAQPINVAGN